METVTVPSYIGDILYDMTGIKGAFLHQMVEDAIKQDGKVPTEEEWSHMVDSMQDELTALELEKVYPHATEALAKIFLPLRLFSRLPSENRLGGVVD